MEEETQTHLPFVFFLVGLVSCSALSTLGFCYGGRSGRTHFFLGSTDKRPVGSTLQRAFFYGLCINLAVDLSFRNEHSVNRFQPILQAIHKLQTVLLGCSVVGCVGETHVQSSF